MSDENPTYADFIGALIGWIIAFIITVAIYPIVSPGILGVSLAHLIRMYRKIREGNNS